MTIKQLTYEERIAAAIQEYQNQLDAHKTNPLLPKPSVEIIAQRFSINWINLLEKINDIRLRT